MNQDEDWSPADHSYSIAVCEAQWAFRTAGLCVMRMRDLQDYRVGFGSHQIDARQLIKALRDLLTAEQLEQTALEELGMDPAVGAALAAARERFEKTFAGVKDMRDALIHFEDWSRGTGHGPQAQARKAGMAPRDVARESWGFGYDPQTDLITFGKNVLDVSQVEQASYELSNAIYMAARAVDAATRALADA